MLRRKRRNMPHDAECGTGYGVNAAVLCTRLMLLPGDSERMCHLLACIRCQKGTFHHVTLDFNLRP